MGKLGDAYLAIVPQLDDSAMSGAVSGIQGKLSGVANAGKVAFAAVGAAATAAAGYVVKSALDGYSAYEQNLGGIQKIFGNMGKSLEEYASLTGQSVDSCAEKWQALENSQNTMLANANQAWQTAGLSASAYMEQATSFGASLVSSLGGDTQKAVEYANTALVDMSDNANTFGTNIQSIQDAYQGFAKQNYTMLDNLKLGYGGTKEEMQRLIQDAAAVSDSVDADSMSFDNCVQAIHVMQEQMNIFGTTAREAATTIEGSVSSMKAAWENWLTGLGNEDADLSQLTANLVTSFEGVASNVIPRVAVIVSTLVSELPGLLAEVGPTLAQSLSEVFGSALESVRASLPDELAGVFDGIGATVSQLASDFSGVGEALSGALGPALTVAGEIIQGVAEVFASLSAQAGEVLAPALTDTLIPACQNFLVAIEPWIEPITNVAEIFGNILVAAITLVVDALGLVIQTAAEIVTSLMTVAEGANGFVESVTSFFSQLPGNISAFLTSAIGSIASWVSQVASNAVQAGSQFISNIVSFFSQLPGNVANFLSSAISSIASFVGQCLSNAQSAGQNFLSGIQSGFNSAVSFVAGIPGQILGALGNVGSLLWDAGSSIINGLLNGIKSAIDSVYSFVSGIAGTIASLKGPLPYDRRLLIPNGQAIMESLYSGLQAGYGDVRDLVSSMAPDLSGAFGAVDVSTSAALVSAVGSGPGNDSGVSLSGVLERLDSIVSRLDQGETAIYVDGKKLASSIAKPMNAQLGLLAARGL